MSNVNDPLHQSPQLSTRAIQRTIWITLAALVITLALFAGYYIWDRYIHLDDRSPIELGVERMEATVHQDPQNPDTRAALAESYLRSGQYAEALTQTDQVLALYSEHAGALLIAGLANVRLNRPQEAVEPLEKFVLLRRDRPMAHTDAALEAAYYFLGESYVKLERPADALSALEAALAITPTDADALYQMGLAHQALGQPQMALELYARAVRLVPDFIEAYEGMVESYSALDESDHVTYAQGMVAFCQKDYRSAATYLEQATDALPDFAPAFLGLGLAYEGMGELRVALSAIQRALDLDPEDLAAQQALSRIQKTIDSRNWQDDA